jgi:hypothetical protein
MGSGPILTIKAVYVYDGFYFKMSPCLKSHVPKNGFDSPLGIVNVF